MRPAFLLSERPTPPPPRPAPASYARPAAAPPPAIATPPAWDLARRRVAVRLPEGAEPGGMRVLHHLLSAPDPGPDPTPHPGPDPTEQTAADDADLARHLQGGFGLRLATELAGPAAARLAAFAGAALHLALPLRGATDALAALAAARAPIAGIEITCAEAATDLAAFAALRAATARAGIALALGGITAGLLAIAEPESLGADLLVLAADPALAEATARLARLRGAVGAGRLLLADADSEDWLRWGVAQGIRRFRGGQIDMLLAAARRLVCAHAGSCPLPVCAARAAFMGASTRAGCANLALLDRAA